jgi:hypothetical protein
MWGLPTSHRLFTIYLADLPSRSSQSSSQVPAPRDEPQPPFRPAQERERPFFRWPRSRWACSASASYVLALTPPTMHVDPVAAPALTGTCPAEPGSPNRCPEPVKETLGRVKDQLRPIRQGSSGARHRGPGGVVTGASSVGVGGVGSGGVGSHGGQGGSVRV